MRRPAVASSSPRSIRSQSGSTLERRAHRHRTVPACWRAWDVRICRCWEKSARLQGSARTRTPSLAIFSTLGDTARWLGNGNEAADRGGGGVRYGLPGKRGTDRVGWYACPRRTLFATEWSAARKNPMRAAALHFSAAISADVKARRILTSGRRKFPSGNFRSARDLEVAKRVRRGQAYSPTLTRPRLPGDRTARLRHRNPSGPSPFARNRGMSPFLTFVWSGRAARRVSDRRCPSSLAAWRGPS